MRAPLVVGLLALIPAALTVIAMSMPGGDFDLFLLASGLWVAVGLGWLAALVWRRDSKSEPRWLWGLGPTVLLLTVALAVSGLPLYVRFALSRPAFERLPAHPEVAVPYVATGQAGLYPVRCCFEQTDFGYRFGVEDRGNTIWGFAYSPQGRPVGPDIDSGLITYLREGDNAYRHLEGPWYVWEHLIS